MKLLNSGAWWNGTSGSYYNNSTTATNVNFTNYKLSDKAKSYITTSRYYLGGYKNQTPLTNEMYGYERGIKRYNTDRPLYWEGMVGLMYPSDYGYAAGNECVTGTDLKKYNKGCQAKDWIYNSSEYQWTITPMLSGINYAYRIGVTGLVVEEIIYIDMSLSPVFYLTSTTSITSGSGTQDDPYLVS